MVVVVLVTYSGHDRNHILYGIYAHSMYALNLKTEKKMGVRDILLH